MPLLYNRKDNNATINTKMAVRIIPKSKELNAAYPLVLNFVTFPRPPSYGLIVLY